MKRVLLGVTVFIGVLILAGSAMAVGAFPVFRDDGRSGSGKSAMPAARRQVGYRQLLLSHTASLSEKTGQRWKVRRTFHLTDAPESSIGRLWLNQNSVNLEEQAYKFANPGRGSEYFKAHLPENSADRNDIPDTMHVLNPNKAVGGADESQLVCITNAPTRGAPSRCFRWVLWRQYGQYNVKISMTMPRSGPDLSWNDFSTCVSVFDELIAERISQ